MIAAIREATAPLHKQLEELLYAEKIMNKTLQENELIHILQTNYLFFEILEKKLSSIIELNEFTPKRAELAANDLETLGAKISNETDFLGQVDLSKAVGLLYVALGSTLGAKVIHAKLSRMPHLNHHHFLFFEPNEADQTTWQNFLTYLHHSEDLDQGKVVEGAIQGFNCLIENYRLTYGEEAAHN